jgi:rhamnulokinase
MAVPTDSDDAVYISSGTWSLMGCELLSASVSDKGRIANFTNEGGFDYRYRFLKNIMGLWMIQSVRNEIGKNLSFGEICEGAKKADIESLVSANDDRFLAPGSMTEEIKAACHETGQQIPQNIYEFARVIYRSLAVCYKETIREMEEITGKTYSSINIVGGGSNADYLNELTALETGKTVYAGPTEATAIGNIIAQMIAAGEVKDLKTARKLVFDSFKVQTIGGK